MTQLWMKPELCLACRHPILGSKALNLGPVIVALWSWIRYHTLGAWSMLTMRGIHVT